MKKLHCAALTLAVAALAARPAAADENQLDEGSRLLAPISVGHLTLVPVATTRPEGGKSYQVLDEGMKSGKVKIVETGSVNELILINSAREPLFLMGGEVVIGGKQDRIIGKDTVVPPGKKVAIPVFCVEHGRWSGRRAEFSSAGALAHTKLRVNANAYDQAEVWQAVKEKNVSRNTENATDTYREIATGGGTRKAVADYERAFARELAKVPEPDKLVGFVVAVNGNVVGVDVFGSPGLFRKLRGKLLRSYYVEAVDVPADGKPSAPPKPQAVKDFLKRSEDAKTEVVLDGAASRTERKKGKGVVESKVVDKAAPAAEAGDVFHSVHAE